MFMWRGLTYLVGGFNPFEKYSPKWVHLPQFSGCENKKTFETTINLDTHSQEYRCKNSYIIHIAA